MSRGTGTARPSRRIRIFVMAAGVALVLVVGLAWWLQPRRLVLPPLPDPNGYDDLLAAGQSISRGTPAEIDAEAATLEQLRDWVTAHAGALERARVGLGRPTAVPLDPDHELLSRAQLDNLSNLREVARLLRAEGVLQLREGHPERAAEIAADLLRLGQATARGGILVDHLTALAIESMGLADLARLVNQLPAEQAGRMARLVQELDETREPLEKARIRDRDLSRARADWKTQILMMIHPALFSQQVRAAEAAGNQADKRRLAQSRLVAVTMALRAYQLRHPNASIPDSVEALVPEFLTTVPSDPFGNGPLRWTVQLGVVRPYSVGPDGVDNAGMPLPSTVHAVARVAGDLTLESFNSAARTTGPPPPAGRPEAADTPGEGGTSR